MSCPILKSKSYWLLVDWVINSLRYMDIFKYVVAFPKGRLLMRSYLDYDIDT